MGKNEETLVAYNIISSSTEFKGEFKSTGNVRIDGLFSGLLSIGGKLVVGKDGCVEGQIICRSAEVEGKITVSTLEVAELLVLKATAVVIGDVKVDKLSIEQGATFVGHCAMSFDNNSQQ